MILSASRRTDIPAFYFEWFTRRLKEQRVLVRNPMNVHQISEIDLAPENIDGIVFWTKNPLPMLNRLWALCALPWYLQFTLTPYGTDIETSLPSKETLVVAFRELSARAGSRRIVWRYDPILFTDVYTYRFHKQCFSDLAAQLEGATDTCNLSFLDLYRSTKAGMHNHHLIVPSDQQMRELAEELSAIGMRHGIYVHACCEPVLAGTSVLPAACIDKTRLEAISGIKLKASKDRNQRPLCACAESIDIGAYNTCANGCLYCYANRNTHAASENHAYHDPDSALLLGDIGPGDHVTKRVVHSLADKQIRFV